MVSETSGTGGFAFLDEDGDSNFDNTREKTISKYKASLMREYEDEMRRKQ